MKEHLLTPESGGGCPPRVPLATGRGGRQGTSSDLTVVVLHREPEEEAALRRRVDLNPVLFGSKPHALARKGEGRDRAAVFPVSHGQNRDPREQEDFTSPGEHHSNPCTPRTLALGLGKQGSPLPWRRRASAGRTVDLRPRLRPRSEVGGGLGRLLPSLASNGPASLLPDGDAVAGTDLLRVLEKAGGACDDATGQPLS